MTERATADLVGVAVFVAGVVAVIDGAFQGAANVTALVGGGAVVALLLAVGAAAWLLSHVARWLLPARWRGPPFPAAVAVAVVLFLAVFVPAAATVAARHRDPQMVSIVVAILGVALAWLVMAVALPLVVRGLQWLLALVGRIPRPKWARVLTVTTIAWALAAMGWVVVGSPSPPRGALAVQATRAWAALIDLDGDGEGPIEPPGRRRGRP